MTGFNWFLVIYAVIATLLLAGLSGWCIVTSLLKRTKSVNEHISKKTSKIICQLDKIIEKL